MSPFRQPCLVGVLGIAAFFGTYLGIWFSLSALHYTSATVATILNSTSPLFNLPLTVLLLKEKLSTMSVIGTVTAVTGIVLLFTR